MNRPLPGHQGIDVGAMRGDRLGFEPFSMFIPGAGHLIPPR